MIWQNLGSRQFRAFGQFFVRHQRHWAHPFRQALLFFRIIELAILAQNQSMIRGIFDHLRCPHDTPAGIITAKDGHDHPVIGANVFKSAENARWDVENIALFQSDFARGSPTPPEKPPTARKNKECLGCAMIMQ